jgi:hypothetical protein
MRKTKRINTGAPLMTFLKSLLGELYDKELQMKITETTVK